MVCMRMYALKQKICATAAYDAAVQVISRTILVNDWFHSVRRLERNCYNIAFNRGLSMHECAWQILCVSTRSLYATSLPIYVCVLALAKTLKVKKKVCGQCWVEATHLFTAYTAHPNKLVNTLHRRSWKRRLLTGHTNFRRLYYRMQHKRLKLNLCLTIEMFIRECC